MAVTSVQRDTFRNGSKTYYSSSLFFPQGARDDVYALYGFVRVADNFVDAVPQDASGFHAFTERYQRALAGMESGDGIIDAFVEVMERKQFKPEWVDSFLHAMELDLTKSTYQTIDETIDYIYGSAEVVGLFMAQILGLPAESHYAARMLGRAMQYINFIRDIQEDRALGRRYLPLTETTLPDLQEETARSQPREFIRFIRSQIDRYRDWQHEAEEGYRYIPRRFLIPIKTASDMYKWTAEQIREDPFVIFSRKVKPAKYRILLAALGNSFGL